MKVLFFIDRLRLGGIQALTYDIIKHNDEGLMEIEILNLDDGQDYPLTHTLEQMGVTIHRLNGIWVRTPLDFPRYFRAVRAFFEEHHDYDVVHVHSSSKNYYILKCAAKWGIPVRVAHSHNTGFQTHNLLSVLLGNLMKRPMKRYATHCLGCSSMACDWLFGAGSVERGDAQVLLNGIDASLFAYNSKIREEVRNELHLNDKFVIGHVGRFEQQKNHAFLLDIFAEVLKRRADAVLVLIGIGSLMETMKQKAATLGVSDKVMFMGFRDDRNRIMQAMDSFVFPSLHEGLSVVLIEAQATSLPVFASNSTTPETLYSPHMKFLSLNQSASEWADAIVSKGVVERVDMTDTLSKAGFEIRTMIRNIYNLYTSKQKAK